MPVVLAVATILEEVKGTTFAKAYIYDSPFFVAFWGVLTAFALAYILKKKRYKNPLVFLIHLAFLVVLLGALVTWLSGKKGMVHLREGQRIVSYTDEEEKQIAFPFAIVLDKFTVVYYSGTQTPQDFVSEVIFVPKDEANVAAKVSMNKIVSYKGFRFYQSGYDKDAVEIMCHGGPAVVKAVYNLCLKNGFRPAERGEFTFRSFIHGKTDLTRAEAVREIIDSKTGTAQTKAADRLSGTVFHKIEEIKTTLLTILAAAEAGVEYPEDEETIADSFDPSELEPPLHALKLLDSSWQNEKIYQNGIHIVLAGKTNAGKSSLFNALLKEDRAIVSDVHGTTRDWLEADLDFNGIPVKLFDTAGLRTTDDTIEAIGVQRSVERINNADAVLYLIDGTDDIDNSDYEFMQRQTLPLIAVFTKRDITQTETAPQLPAELHHIPVVSISSHTGEGLPLLIETVIEKTTEVVPVRTETDVLLGTERQRNTVHHAVELLSHAQEAAQAGFPLDAVIQDIEDAVHTLGEITGEIRSDDILDKIFSDFCVGK